MEITKSTYQAGYLQSVNGGDSYLRSQIRSILEMTGIRINGSRRYDIHVANERFYSEIFARHSMGLGESYMEGWWDVPKLDEFFYRIFSQDIDQKVKPNWKMVWAELKAKFLNLQYGHRSYQVGEKHYDLGNDLFQAMLDSRMVYTCGYWKERGSLAEAQECKLDLVCQKLGLKYGDRVLDVGGGWGSFAKFAAEKYGAHVTAITISKEQAELGQKQCHGLPVEIRLQNYRDLGDEKFDHIVSLGMFEHVGHKNYRQFMEIMNSSLKENGLFLLHTIGSNESNWATDPWIDKYIFPNSLIPSIQQMGSALEGLFVMEDWHNFGLDYDKTLMAWFKNFDQHWERLKPRYEERFYRMWKYYLLQSAGLFRARKKQVWQLVLSKKGVPHGYASVR